MEKITELYDRMKKMEIGSLTIGDGIEKGKVWIENAEGEGGDFPIEDIEKLLIEYLNKHF